MIDLNKIINDSLAKIEAEGYVQEIVEKRIKETLNGVVRDCLETYSDFGKNLKEEVKASLNINLKELDIPQYNALVLNAVKEKLSQVVTVQGIEKINEAMDKMLADVKPEYTLSEIIEVMKGHEQDSKDYSDSMTLFIENGNLDGYSEIYLDADQQDRKYSCSHHIRLDKNGTAWHVKLNNRELDKNKLFGALFGVDELLFKIYATGAKVVLDQGEDADYYDLSYHDED